MPFDSQGTRTEQSFSRLDLDSVLPKSGSFEETLGRTQSISLDESGTSGHAPQELGRYQITELLGEGGYGRVFKAFDEQLQRHVAIKVPHRYRIDSPRQLNRYLDEARTLAKLEHPNIVAIHDVLLTDDEIPCIVSAYIEGSSLADRLVNQPPTLREALEILITIGDALAFVHSRGIVHRDVKPGNILLSQMGQPFLADFGLALHDDLLASSRGRVGTPAYMSPEQARGENHLIDGRSDVFSLGVVLYQMLTGKRPFAGSDHESVVQNLMHREPLPPRQIVGALPRELERICLKALAKRSSDRYGTASDFVEDLKHFIATIADAETEEAGAIPSTPEDPSEGPAGVVPRGLRAFDRHDSEFFHRLVPGPRDREWVPESLRFWQRRIVGPEESELPRVGVLYGPSGCGKSSFVKAGLIPLLGHDVIPLFVEATHDDTEMRILRQLRKRCPEMNINFGLKEALAEIRKRRSLSVGPKYLVVIDQFEQWLYGRDVDESSVLSESLRQCDGVNLQCLLLVRDDFWLALSRFMSAVEVPLRQNHNAALVDLFDASHARKVLAEFGVAYGRIPFEVRRRSLGQNQFLDRSVEELSERGKVFPVRLALFVEMLKDQPWEAETLRRLGGVEGIGYQFLEESFSSELAPAAQRTHEPAVRKVLKLLLPEAGIDIKGKMQPEDALLQTSGYGEQRALFDEMIRILDTDLRLITPTDPAGTTSGDDSLSQSSEGTAYYQLTHDYLVPAVERWITRGQRETRRGRAELRLAEYASLWASKPTRKFEPPWLDWLSIKVLSSPSRWNATEQKLMKSATNHHLVNTAVVLVALFGVVSAIWGLSLRGHSRSLVQQLQTVRNDQAASLLAEIDAQSLFTTDPLTKALSTSTPGSREMILNRLGLETHDPAQRKQLLSEAMETTLPLVMLIRNRLGDLTQEEIASLRTTISDGSSDAERKLRAAILLAAQKIDGLPWKFSQAESSEIVSEMLRHTSIAPQDNVQLIEAFYPVRKSIEGSLLSLALTEEPTATRSLSTAFVIQFLKEDPGALLNFFLDASFEQHESILSVLEASLPKVQDRIRSIAFSDSGAMPDSEMSAAEQFDRTARRKGVAAALLHRLGKAEETWVLFGQSERPNARSFMIQRIGPLGGEFAVLLSRISREPDAAKRRAIMHALGQFEWKSISDSDQAQAVAIAKDVFVNDPDVGNHSMAQFLLNRWGEKGWLRGEVARQGNLPPDYRKSWYVTPEGHTMAVFDARDVPGIGRVFAISTHEVTVEQFLRFRPEHKYFEHRSPTPDCPAGMTNWFDCLGYCRWVSNKLDPDGDGSYPQELTAQNPRFPYDKVTDGSSFRLPTAAEWRYACAAGTTSRRYYGLSDELASGYFWYLDTSQNEQGDVRYYPAGMMPPNDFGMFAMYDGVREWCHDRKQNRRMVSGFTSSSERGVPYSELDRAISATPSDLPLATNGFYGLRIARTLRER